MLKQKFFKFIKFARQLSGDDAYERYLEHHAAAHPSAALLSRKQFFMQEQERKWDGVKRCC
ncbi:MAG: CstA-like transporter-associated (seleno)protein [Gammaproteobacteria bacterium]